MKVATDELRGRPVYLAGPMRGYPRYNFDAFAEAAEELRRRHVVVISPAEMDLDLGFDPDKTVEEQGFDVDEALRRDVAAITCADAVVFLEGAERSAGCLVEYEVAKALGIPTYSLDRCHVRPGEWVLRRWTYEAGDRVVRHQGAGKLMALGGRPGTLGSIIAAVAACAAMIAVVDPNVHNGVFDALLAFFPDAIGAA